MIQAKELRQGNLVHLILRNGKIHLPETSLFLVIQELMLFKVSYLFHGENPANAQTLMEVTYADLSPIPLTEEILLKCGFKKIEPEGWYRKVTEREASMELFNGSPFHYADGNFSPDINYLHQLQNLYYSLTGEELTFNPQTFTEGVEQPLK